MKLIVNINLRVCYVAQVYVDTDGNVLQKAISTVNTVESGNLHSVTSNAVANGLSKLQYLFPMRLEMFTTSATDWDIFLWIGSGFYEKYQSYPNINGKTKKCNLLMTLYTAQNHISVGVKRQNDEYVTVLVNEVNVWGGNQAHSYGKLISIPIDPTFLQSLGYIYVKSSMAGVDVSLANVFVEVNYE